MSYREWEEDPRNRRGRHSAPDGWIASDDTSAGQAGRRRRDRDPEGPTGPYQAYDGYADTTDAGSRYLSSSGRRSEGPYGEPESRGWTAPDRLDDTGAWTRGAHTGEWQRPDDGWPARPEPDSAPPAPYLPAPWAERAALEPGPAWPSRPTDHTPGRREEAGYEPGYREQPRPAGRWSESGDPEPGGRRSAEGRGGYEGYEGGRRRREEPGAYGERGFEPRTYGRPALPAAEPPAAPPAGAGAYSGEVLPPGYRSEPPPPRRAEPPATRPTRAERRAIGAAPTGPAQESAPPYRGSGYRSPPPATASDPYAATAYQAPTYRDPHRDEPRREEPRWDEPRPSPYRDGYREDDQRRYRDEPAYRDRPPADDRPTQHALPAYREPPAYGDGPRSYRDLAPVYRDQPKTYRDGPTRSADDGYAERPPARSGVAEYRRAADGYGGRPVAALPSAQRRASVYDVDEDDDDLEEEPEPGGYVASMVYTVMWYAVPMVAWVLWSLTLNSEASANCVDDAGVPCESERVEALSTLVESLPRLGGTLLLSIVFALLLRRISSSWKAATVGFAAAVVGGGLATVGVSVVTGQPIG